MKHKKAAFESINNMMIGFVGFVLIVVLCIVMISIFKSTTLVCANDITNRTSTYYNGACYSCAWNGTSATAFNSTDSACHNTTATRDTQGAGALTEYSGAAYNATKYLNNAALLPPQFASLIVIVVIIIGILGLLSVIGYNAYKKMKD